MKPVIAIIGRANVGKSTLFNRLVGKQIAIVEDHPGTTRDRVFADTSLQGHDVTVIDTGGLEPAPESSMDQKVKGQVDAALSEADVIIFLMDIREGVIATDLDIAEQIRKCDKPVVVAVNKADTMQIAEQIGDFYRIGLGTPLAISAHHSRGISTLVDTIITHLPSMEAGTPMPEIPKLAIVGRPNVGKSMLLNTIVGKERAIVDSVPGTTRDATDTIYNYRGHEIVLIDTAGIRRRKYAGTGIDYYSLIRSLRAINRCDIALLVIDATEYITAQDTHIAGYIKEACKGMVVIINKWDLITGQQEEYYAEIVRERLKFISHSPVLFTSAKYGHGVEQVISEAMKIWSERQKLLPNSVIDKLVKQATDEHAPPRKGTKRLEIVRAYQDGINPPSFVFLVNDPKLVHFSYRRYLENKLRQTFGFFGTSLNFSFRKAPRRKPGKAQVAR
jgi:GTP-binding protein